MGRHRLTVFLAADAPVAHRELVHGRGGTGVVTIYVLARDGKWYLQAPSDGPGDLAQHWQASLVFGDEDVPTGTPYRIAVRPGHNLTHGESPLTELPEPDRWTYVDVQRI